jgi:hypothetical protein
METGTGFDFLATKDGVELEVECKRVGLSLGRKIPRLETLRLHRKIHAQVKPSADNLIGGLLLRVFLPDRLTANESDQKAIAEAVGAACRTSVAPVSQVCEIEMHGFQINGTPFETASGQDDVPGIQAFLEQRFNVKNREVLILGKKTKGALAVSIESRRDDSLMEKLFSELGDSAANQFSKTKPGVLCVQFMDLTDDQIRRMGSSMDDRSPSYILLESSKFLSSPSRSHVHSIAYRAYGSVGQSESIHGDVRTIATQEQGSAYVISNDTHPLAKDRRYAIFGGEEPPPSCIVSA